MFHLLLPLNAVDLAVEGISNPNPLGTTHRLSQKANYQQHIYGQHTITVCTANTKKQAIQAAAIIASAQSHTSTLPHSKVNQPVIGLFKHD
jgi:hypothetical protein